VGAGAAGEIVKRWAALLLLACGVPESLNPLVPAEKAVLDKALLGTWVGGDDESDPVTLVMAQKSGAVMTVSAPGVPGEDGKSPRGFEAHASTLDGMKYLNARAIEDGKPASNWMIVRYELSREGTLTLWAMKDGVVREAFAKKTLKGKEEGASAQLTITDSVEKLAAFIKKTKGLYEPLGTFKRK
jgi:hypothetical protein